MLNSMRSNRKILSIILWIVIIAFVSTIFVVWGIGSRENQASYAAKVGDSVIGYDEYRTYYENTIQQLRSMLGSAYDTYAKGQNLDAIVLQKLIDRELMLNEAKRLKIPASDYEIIDTIKNIEIFQGENGQFDSKKYEQVLGFMRMTPEKFEASVKNDILINKFQRLVSDGQYAVSNTELLNEYNYRGTTAQISYFSVPADSFISDKTPEAKDISSYYDSHKESYRVPAQIKLKYITFNKDDYQGSDIIVDSKEIENYYNSNIAAYTEPENVVVRNIAISAANKSNAEEMKKAKEKIEEALKELKSGEDFIAVVKKYSDPSAAANDGLIGKITRGQLSKNLEDKIFETEEGQYTDVLESNYGFHIVKVEEKHPQKIYSLDEKKDEIEVLLKNNKIDASYRNNVLNTYKDILKAGNITAYMNANSSNNLDVHSTPLFKETEEGIPLFSAKKEAKADVFKLNKMEMSQLIEDGSVTYLFEAEDKIASGIPPLDEIMEKVTEDYKKSESEKTGIKEIAEEVNKNGFEQTAEKYKSEILKSGEFRRSLPDSTFAFEKELIESVFKSKPGETLNNAYLIGGKIYAIKVENIIPPAADDIVKEIDAISSYIRTIKAEEAMASYIDSLRAKTKISINPSFLGKKGSN